MSYWNGKEIIHFASQPIENYPGWEWHDCSCCAGLTWHYGNEHELCGGSGRTAFHIKSGVSAKYPGGPLLGRRRPSDFLASRAEERHAETGKWPGE